MLIDLAVIAEILKLNNKAKIPRILKSKKCVCWLQFRTSRSNQLRHRGLGTTATPAKRLHWTLHNQLQKNNYSEQSTKIIYKKSLIASEAPPKDQEAPGHPDSPPWLLGSALP